LGGQEEVQPPDELTGTEGRPKRPARLRKSQVNKRCHHPLKERSFEEKCPSYRRKGLLSGWTRKQEIKPHLLKYRKKFKEGVKSLRSKNEYN